MKLHILDLPDTHDELATWLESRFLGPDLGELVAQLQDMRPIDAPAGRPLEKTLAEYGDAVLSRGLKALPESVLSSLVAQPRQLLDLQDWVLAADVPYWNKLTGAADALQLSQARGGMKWTRFLADQAQVAPAPVRRRPWYSSPPMVAIGTAAALVLAFRMNMENNWVEIPGLKPPGPTQVAVNPPPVPPPAAPVGWGWNNPDNLKGEVPADQYLAQLANGAEEWFKKRPADHKALATRISQFRRGCTELLLSEHKPLAEKDRDWLLERCRAWAGKFDGHLAAAEAGADTEKTLAEMDETVTKLIKALRTRSEEVRA